MAGVSWRFTTRPMGDTPTYRAAADGLRSGWPHLLDRTPGYPAVMLLTGSADGSTVALFCAQIVMHALCVVLVLDALRFVGIGRWGRLAGAVLLMAPPVMLRVVYEGTEATAALLLTVLFWLLVVPERSRGVDPAGARKTIGRVLSIGAACGLLALVRPTFALVFIPVAAMWVVGVRVATTRSRRSVVLGAALIAAPTILLVGALVVSNGVRFDSYGVTPLLPYHLSSRTSSFVEELPPSYEPARSVLITARDRALLAGESTAPANYVWGARADLEEATGLEGPALDRYVMRMQAHLILHNPFGYLDAVRASLSNMTTMDSQPAILGPGRPVVWVEQVLHLLLTGLFVAAVAVLPGLGLAGRLSRRTVRFAAVGAVLVCYTVTVSVMIESGTARLRAPVEPLLVGLLVVGVAEARSTWSRRSAAGPDPGRGDLDRPDDAALSGHGNNTLLPS